MISDINSAVRSTDNKSPSANQALYSTTNTLDNLAPSQQGEAQKAPLVELSSTVERAYAVLSYEVSVELNMVFGNLGLPASTQPALVNNLTNDTADNILNTVKTAANAIDGEQRNELLGQARDGVDRGIAVAKDVLQGQGALTGQVNSEIATAQETIQSGISALGGIENNAPVVSESAVIATRSRQQDSGDIQIRTNDGDVISINFSQTQEESMLMVGSTDANGSYFGAASTQSTSVSYRFSIEGNLDKDETEALGKLVHDIEEVSDKFFSGELKDAFDKLSELKFSSEEFSGMAMNFSRSESLLAIGAYQTVQTMEEPAANNSSPAENVPVVTNNPSTPVTVPPVTQAPAIVAAVAPVPVAAPMPTPESKPTTPASMTSAPIKVASAASQTPVLELTGLQSLIGEVRQLITDLSNMNRFSKPETIAVDLFEGIAKSKGQGEHVAGVALDQFNQVLGLLSAEDNDAKVTGDGESDQNKHVANIAFDQFNQALAQLSEEDQDAKVSDDDQDIEHGAAQPQQMI